MVQKLRSGLQPGDLVRARGDCWRVAGLSAYVDCEALHLDGINAANRGLRRTLLFPFDRPAGLHRDSHLRVVRRAAWCRAFRALASAVAPHDSLQTAASARIDLLSYQLEPALAVLRGRACRLLLADEVGLGKTIQAGLVLKELLARGQADRTLILTPAGLRDQWAHELSSRFDIDTDIVDGPFLRSVVTSLSRGVNPWTLAAVRIASFDFIKRAEVLRSLEEIVWDLVLIDEAHGMTGDSDRGIAGRALTSRARHVVLLTATPHAGDEAAFVSLCDLGRLATAGDRHPIVIFRRSRVDVGLTTLRRTRLLPVRPTPEERRMHRLVDLYTNRVWRAATARGHDAALLAMLVLKKRALSSARSLATSAARRLDHLGNVESDPLAQPPLPLESESDEVDRTDEEPREVLAPLGLGSTAHERAWLGAIHAAALAAAGSESKLSCLRRLLRRVGEPAIVFTEYRDTLLRIASTIAPLTPIALLHGGLTREERRAAEERFTSGTAQVLLATDAAGEGLNLQACCRLVVNCELPWSPMRLEQRAGRVDRIGQDRPVHVIHLLARDTAETEILARLVRRLARVRASLGHIGDVVGAVPERVIADAMVRGDASGFLAASSRKEDPVTPHYQNSSISIAPAPHRGITHIDLRPQAAIELRRLRFVRQVRPVRSQHRSDTMLVDLERTAPWLTILSVSRLCSFRTRSSNGPLHTLGPGVICLFRARLADRAGHLIETMLIPVRAPVTKVACIRSRRDARIRTERLLSQLDHAIRQAARRAVAERLVAAQPDHATVAASARKREVTIASLLDTRLARSLVQLGLFDRRTLRQAEPEKRRRATQRSDVELRLQALDASMSLSLAGELELMLVLVVTGGLRTRTEDWVGRGLSKRAPSNEC